MAAAAEEVARRRPPDEWRVALNLCGAPQNFGTCDTSAFKATSLGYKMANMAPGGGGSDNGFLQKRLPHASNGATARAEQGGKRGQV